jgi:hypothetical protein
MAVQELFLQRERVIGGLSLTEPPDGLPSFIRREVSFADRSSLREQKAGSSVHALQVPT